MSIIQDKDLGKKVLLSLTTSEPIAIINCTENDITPRIEKAINEHLDSFKVELGPISLMQFYGETNSFSAVIINEDGDDGYIESFELVQILEY